MILEKSGARRAGRPKSEEKKAAILEAAGCLFLTRGLQQASMDAVAAEAGVSKQTVYSHFKNKEDLFRACITEKVASYQMDNRFLDPATGVREALLQIGSHFLDLIFDEEVVCMFRLVIGESASYPQIARVFDDNGPERAVAAVQGFLEASVKRGDLVIDDIRYAAVLFLNMVGGEYRFKLLMNLDVKTGKRKRRLHVEKAVDQFLALYRHEK